MILIWYANIQSVLTWDLDYDGTVYPFLSSLYRQAAYLTTLVFPSIPVQHGSS